MSEGGFRIDPTVGYAIYAQLQNDTTPTSATLATGAATFSVGNPSAYNGWFGVEGGTGVWPDSNVLTVFVGTVTVTGPGLISRESARLEGFMLDMTNLMGG